MIFLCSSILYVMLFSIKCGVSLFSKSSHVVPIYFFHCLQTFFGLKLETNEQKNYAFLPKQCYISAGSGCGGNVLNQRILNILSICPACAPFSAEVNESLKLLSHLCK